MRPVVPMVLALLLALPAAAAPVLTEGRSTPQGYCFPDHAERNVWWLAPVAAELKQIGGRPAVDFTTYRYQGNRATGDDGMFTGGTVLQFALVFPPAARKARDAATHLGAGAQVRALQPESVETEIVFAGINSPARAATPEERETAASAGWEERAFSLSLTPEETEVVTRMWETGALVLSVNLVASATGYRTRPPADSEDDPQILPVLVDSIPVTLNASEHPQAFHLLELDATMSAGYTSLEIGCTEFAEARGFSDLARVRAIVEATSLKGDVLQQTARFSPGSAVAQNVRFDRAVRLDDGYRVRVVRVFATGLSEEAETRRVDVWQGFVNVCSTGSSDRQEPDPRLLY